MPTVITLDIDDDLFEEIQRLAVARQQTFETVFNEQARLDLTAMEEDSATQAARPEATNKVPLP